MAERELHDAGTPDPDAPPSEEEVVASLALRRALEDPAAPSPPVGELARSLRAAHAPAPLEGEEHRRIVERALDANDARRKQGESRGRVIRVTFGGAAMLALAASVLLMVGQGGDERAARTTVKAPPSPPEELRTVRSTQPLFNEGFNGAGAGATARIDRIAMARASDLRENRFARWGVR